MSHYRFLPRIPTRIGKLGIVLFFTSLSAAFVGSIISIYVNSFVNNESIVGFIFTALVLVSIIANFMIIPLVESRSKKKLFIYAGALTALGYFAYSIINNFKIFILIAVCVTILTSMRIAAAGLLIEHSSNKRNLSKNEGLMYTFINLAWVIGPLIVGLILAKLDVLKYIFLLSSGLMIIAVILFVFFRINYSGKRKKLDSHPLKNFKDFFKNKHRVKAYVLSGGVNLWWGLIFIYMPLLIIKNLSDSWVGFFLFFTTVPLIFLEYYFGSLASRRGYKKIFLWGYLIPAAAAIISFFFFSNIWIIIIALSLASIGLSMIEGTTEAYFFDILKPREDQRFYSPYNTAVDAGNLFGEFIPAIILLFLPFKSIFLFYAICMLTLGFLSLNIKNVFESKRKAGKF